MNPRIHCDLYILEYISHNVLSSARELATNNIKTAQKMYKEQYDKRANLISYAISQEVWYYSDFQKRMERIGNFPGHGMDPTVIQSDGLYVTVVKQFFLEAGTIQFHHRVETGSGHPGHPGYPGHVLSRSTGSDLVYKNIISGCDPDFTMNHVQ